MEQAKDFWAMADKRLAERWPKDDNGQPEKAEKLIWQPELGGMADITLSMLEGCSIPLSRSAPRARWCWASPGWAWRSMCPPPG